MLIVQLLLEKVLFVNGGLEFGGQGVGKLLTSRLDLRITRKFRERLIKSAQIELLHILS